MTALAVATLATAAFLNGLGGEFVLDDLPFLQDNPQIDAPHSLAYFFTENLWYYSNLPDAYSASYRPLHFIYLWSCNQFLLSSPLSLHVLSLLLHVLVTILLLLTIRSLIPGISPLAAGFAAGLFAVHPVHAEAVAWVSAFIHLLTTIFLLAAFLAHERSRQTGRVNTAIVSFVCFSLALLSNEMAAAFPIFILLNDRVRYGSIQLAKNLPYLVLLFIYMFARSNVLGETVPLVFSDPNMWLRLPVFLLEYLRHLVLPWPQPLYLQMPETWGVSLAALVIGALYIAAGIWLYRIPSYERRVPLIAAIWIAVFLLPPMAAAFSPDARFALRSLYLPSVGFAILLAWSINGLQFLRRTAGIVLMTAILLLALSVTMTANRHWQDDASVYRKIIAWHPGHHAGYLGLGKYYERRGAVEQALAHYEQSALLAESENTTDPLEFLAQLLGQSGNNLRSMDLYRQLTAINPGSASAWTGLGNNLWALGQLEEAADAYRQGHNAEPDNWIACNNLVLVLTKLGRTAEASRYKQCASNRRK